MRTGREKIRKDKERYGQRKGNKKEKRRKKLIEKPKSFRQNKGKNGYHEKHFTFTRLICTQYLQ
jgi:hypothetical protein